MAEEESAKGIPWGVVTGLLALAGGTIAILAPLTSSRPISRTGISEEGYQDQDVAAHLWQDPLEAMETHRRHDKQVSHYDRETHALRHILEQVPGRRTSPEHETSTGGRTTNAPPPRPFEILAVMTQGGADEEKIERRLRDRVAVVEGLSRAGYKPESERYIGYFALPWTRRVLEDPPDSHSGKSDPWAALLSDDLLEKAERLEESEDAKDSGRNAWRDAVLGDPHAGEAKDTTLLRLPFEWFEQVDPDKTPAPHDRQLVLWLDADYFETSPVRRLAQLLGLFAGKDGIPSVKSVILGPESSGTLHAMVEEVQAGKLPEAVCKLLSRTTIYSDQASASDNVLTYQRGVDPAKSEHDVEALLTKKLNAWTIPTTGAGEKPEGFQFHRTIADDEVVFDAALRELKNRGYYFPEDYWEDPSARHGPARRLLALLTEEDTFYGRAMLPEFLTAMKVCDRQQQTILFPRIADLIYQDHAGKMPVADWEYFNGVHPYQYLRGIDGRLPASGGESAEPAEGESGKGEKGGEKPARNDPGKLESPDGTNQSDYLRRLASHLVELNDGMIKQKNPDDHSWSAGAERPRVAVVGVLGSDVYDKLEILHALRKRIPDALFFTNSMDARLFHPAEQSAARNLIVFSAYGLSLCDEYQNNTPPFRDSLQTARFAAVLRAFGVIPADLELKKEKPRIYEIGRTGPWDLSEPDETPAAPEPSKAPGAPGHSPDPAPSVHVTPAMTGNVIPASSGDVTVTSGNQSPPGSAASSGPPRHVHPERTNDHPWWSVPLERTGWLLIGLFVTFQIVITCMTPRENWLRVLITFPLVTPILFLLSFEIIGRIYRHGGATPDAEPFAFFEGISVWPTEGLRIFILLLCLYFWLVSFLQLRENRKEIAKFFGLNDSKGLRPWLGPMATELWNKYLKRTGWWGTSWRVFLFVVGYASFAVAINALLGVTPAPVRSEYALLWDHIMMAVSGTLFLVLTFYVLYAILAIRRLIQHLNVGITNWPDGAYAQWSGWDELDEREMAELIDIRFIARRTEVIAPLIYYPFIIIFIIILSRMPIFDNWDWPISLEIVLGIHVLVATVCAFLLRSSAEEARRIALDRLGEALDRATKDKHREQLRAAIEEVRGVNDGAFAAISQQPIIRAIALQGGGVALLAAVKTLMS